MFPLSDNIPIFNHTASDAVNCAEQLIKSTSMEGKYQLRIAIHLGEVINIGGAVFGDVVNFGEEKKWTCPWPRLSSE